MKTNIRLGELEKTYGKKHRNKIAKLLSNAPESVQKVWNDCVDNFHCLEPKYKGTQACYLPFKDGVRLNIELAAKGSSYQMPYQVVFHEYGHHLDYILNRKYGSGDQMKAFSETYRDGILGKTLKMEAIQHIKDFATANNITDIVQAEYEFCKQIEKELTLIQRADISDIFEPIMSEKCPYPFGIGHGTSYWKNRDNGKEGFAEMYSATVSNSDSLEQIKRFFPKSYKIFLEMLEVIQ